MTYIINWGTWLTAEITWAQNTPPKHPPPPRYTDQWFISIVMVGFMNEKMSSYKNSIHLPFWVSLIVMKLGNILSHTFQSHFQHFSLSVHMFSSYKDALTKTKSFLIWCKRFLSKMEAICIAAQGRAEHLRSIVSLKIYSFVPTDFFKYIHTCM